GPASLLYGSEAIGGILNVIEEMPAEPGKKLADMNAGIFSNTLGMTYDAGYRQASLKRSLGLRLGLSSNADYSDGSNRRILNSRFSGYYLKGSMGFTKKAWRSNNHFSSSLDNFGFITADNQNDKRLD